MNPAEVRIDTRYGTYIRDLVHRIKNNTLVVPRGEPDTSLMESMLLGIPLRNPWFLFYFEEKPIVWEPANEYTKRLVDTIDAFIVVDEPLSNMKYLPELNGKPLRADYKRRLEHYRVNAHGIGDYLPQEIIDDILWRVQ